LNISLFFSEQNEMNWKGGVRFFLWYDFPVKEIRTVLFFIVRLQNKLTSGKIVDLSLEQIISVRFNL